MGIIYKQTSRNIIYTYFGILIGTINTIFLYPILLKDTYYGLVVYLTTAANLLMPLLIMGVQNSLIKHYHTYVDGRERGGFVLLMFTLPLLVSIPIGTLFILFYEGIASYLSKNNNVLIRDYAWMIYLIAVSYAYFEVFYAWAKTHLRSVYGNFLKEIFHRIFVMLFLGLVYLDKMTPQQFVYALGGVFGIRALLMLTSGLYVSRPKFSWCMPKNITRIAKYHFLMLLLGFFTILLIAADKFFIGKLLSFNQVAYYGVAAFISATIAIPNKAMHQIVNTITAQLLTKQDYKSLDRLYKKTAANLYVISGFIFSIIIINLKTFYQYLPVSYHPYMTVVVILGFGRLIENIVGNNNAILFNSNHFRAIFRLLLVMIILVLSLGYGFTILWGVYGAAIASLSIYVVYHAIKIWMVYRYFKIHPFSLPILYTTICISLLCSTFYFWDFNYTPTLNIFLKSILAVISYGAGVYYLNLSEDIKAVFERWLKRFSSLR